MTLIFDTDPGVDDMLALLLLLSFKPEEADLRMITLTYGNCSLSDTLNNTLSLFSVIQKENKWRKEEALPLFTTQRPTIYLGSKQSLTGSDLPDEQEAEAVEGENSVDATDVHGSDGLAGIHETNPEFDAPKSWFNYFAAGTQASDVPELPFKSGGSKPAHEAIIDTLRGEPEGTVTICAVGPLTNLARAAQLDPAAFARVKQVLSMGAALRHPGNVTPLAEFNVYADPLAAAQIYALTSSHAVSMLPPGTPKSLLNGLPKPLRLTLFPLDITEKHDLFKGEVENVIGGAMRKYGGSVLARWIHTWLIAAFSNYGKLVGVGPENASVHLHDPLTAAYALGMEASKWVEEFEDVRVEYTGQWAAGYTVVDNRGRARSDHNPHDIQKWLTTGEGNHVGVIADTPFKDTFSVILLDRIVGL